MVIRGCFAQEPQREGGEFRQPWDTEGAPPCVGRDAEGLRVRVAYCVLGLVEIVFHKEQYKHIIHM